jgi:hypothetical protein
MVQIKNLRRQRAARRPNTGRNGQKSKNVRKGQPQGAVVAIPRQRMGGLSQVGMDFLKCALDPFNSKGSLGAPDSFSGMSVVVDHRTVISIQANANGVISMAVLPTLPGALYIGAGTVTVPLWGVSGSVAGALTNSGGTYMGVIYPQYDGTATVIGAHTYDLGGACSNPYTATRARVLSLSCRVTPTTQLLQASGNVYVGQFADSNYLIGTGRVINAVNGAMVPAKFYNGGYPQLQSVLPACTSTVITQMPDYVQQYVDDGVYVVAKRVDPDFEFQPWAPAFNPIVSNTNATQCPGSVAGQFWQAVANADGTASSDSIGINNTCPKSVIQLVYPIDGPPGDSGAGTGCDGAGPCFIDPGMSSILIAIEGLQTSAAAVPTTFEVEVRTCVEYQVKPQSSVSQFQKASPPEDPAAMRLLSDVMRKMPTAMPAGAVNGSWASMLRNILNGISTGGKQLAKFGLPYVGAAAELADQFGNMFL